MIPYQARDKFWVDYKDFEEIKQDADRNAFADKKNFASSSLQVERSSFALSA
jgi:hypothetical protein